MSGPGGPQSTWPVDWWCDLWKPFRKEAERLLGVGWQPEAVKNGIFANGEATREQTLGGFPRLCRLNPQSPSLYLLSILAYWNHQPLPPITYHLCTHLNHSPVPLVSPVLSRGRNA
nr:MAG TPA: hypothetical protein [Caudoviricetes sp.]